MGDINWVGHMNKKFTFILLSLLLSAPAVWAQNDVLAQKIFNFCEANGGKKTYQSAATVDANTGKTCITAHCSIDSRKDGTTCDINIDTESLPAGCAKATLKTCGSVTPDGQSSGGASNGGASNGGASNGGASNGGASNGGASNGGSSNGRVNRGGDGRVYLDWCDFWVYPGHACYNVCTKRGFPIFGKKGADRKACQECLGALGITVIDSKGRTKGATKISINCSVSGLRKGPNGECIDDDGNVVSGRSTTRTVSRDGGDDDDGRTTRRTTISSRGSIDLPPYCLDPKDRLDRENCEKWMKVNRHDCSSSSRTSSCIGDDRHYDITSRGDRDCPGGNCRGGRGSRGGGGNAWLGDALGALFTAGGQVGSAYFHGRAQERSAQAWAGAAEAGFEQCAISQNNYLTYLSANELPAMSPDQRNAMNCNGYQLGAYGGLGAGGLGGYYGAGYTPGMIGGMIGPYGQYNPYGYGGVVGGAVGGIAQGGYVAGYGQGGYVQGGYVNGYGAGGVIGGAINGAVQGGGYVAGTYAQGGYVNGYGAGGYVNGYAAGGFAAAGYNSGYGLAQGGYGLAQGGYIAAGYGQGGFQGGFNPYGGGIGGGYGGFGSGTGNYGGFGGYNGFGQGTGYYGANPQMDYSASMNASNYDRMLQNQGVSYQMGAGGGGFGGGYGAAGYSPLNAGFTLGANFGYGGF